jgi:hypothetical protein
MTENMRTLGSWPFEAATGLPHNEPISSVSANERNGGREEELTRHRHTIVLLFTILVAQVGGGEAMLAAEFLPAVLGFER